MEIIIYFPEEFPIAQKTHSRLPHIMMPFYLLDKSTIISMTPLYDFYIVKELSEYLKATIVFGNHPRITALWHRDRKLAEETLYFVIQNREFLKYLDYASMTRGTLSPQPGMSIKQMLLYYASNAGYKSEYGQQVYLWVRQGRLDLLKEKKRETIEAIMRLPDKMTREQFEKIKIKGVGEGAMDYVRKEYFGGKGVVYVTDRVVLGGLAHVYGQKKMTPDQAKKIVAKWRGNVEIGDAFAMQIYHYVLNK